MGRITNFDISSSGVNLELTVIRDLVIAQFDVQDSFQAVNNRKLIWNEFGNYDFNASDVEAMWEVPEETTPVDLLMSLREWVDEDEFMELFEKYFELKESLSFVSVFDDAQDLLDGVFEEWKVKYLIPQFEEVFVAGYTQGDYYTVVVPHVTLEGTPYHPDAEEKRGWNEFRDMLCNLLFNAPIWGRLEINDDEIMLDEALSDRYDYNKNEIIQFVKDHEEVTKHPKSKQQYIVEWVSENLPDCPEFT